MRLYYESLKIFIKSKLFWIILSAYMLLSMVQIFREALPSLGVGLLGHTRQILFLSPQILVLYLIIGYEFFSRSYRTHMDESISATTKGFGNKAVKADLAVLISVLFLNYLLFTLFDLLLTHMSFQTAGIEDNLMCSWYIVKCLFVNIFLIGLIGILLGMVLSKIQRRIMGYAAIMAVVLVTSYLLSEIANMVLVLTDQGVNLFDYLDILNIMTPGLNFSSNNALGFPMMTYRICLILFWIFLLIFIYVLRDEKRKRALKIVICLILCTCSFVGYVLPSSRVDMGLSNTGTSMADQNYYNFGNYRIKKEKAGFYVKKYTMDLDVRRLLKAKVTMDVSTALKEYRFTLSHSYEIERVCDGTEKELNFERDGDALLIHNRGGKTKRIIIEYSGANEAYYANSQGMNLRGSFPYYPVAGFHQITYEGLFMNPLFLKKQAAFDIDIKTRQRVYSNLKKNAQGHFVGYSNGPTLVSGLYTSITKKGIRIVYPPFIGWNDDALNTVAEAAVKDGYKDCQIFITPNVNRQDDAVSKEQILTRNYFTSVKEDLQSAGPEFEEGE